MSARDHRWGIGTVAVALSLPALIATTAATSPAVAAPGGDSPSSSSPSCDNHGTVKVTQKQNHHRVSVQCGQRIRVSLPENLDGGPNSARWHAQPVNAKVLRIKAHHYVAPHNAPPGAPGHFHQFYKVHGLGSAVIKLTLRAPGDSSPEKVFKIHVEEYAVA